MILNKKYPNLSQLHTFGGTQHRAAESALLALNVT